MTLCAHCNQPIVRAGDLPPETIVHQDTYPDDPCHVVDDHHWWSCDQGNSNQVAEWPDNHKENDMNEDPVTPVEDRIAMAVAPYRAALELISTRLLAEAKERGWCDEYDTFVADVNRALPPGVPQLTPCERNFSVRFDVTAPESVVMDIENIVDTYLADRGHSACDGFHVERD